MACENEVMMPPCIDFCKGGVRLEEGSEEWKELSKKVREACENYGCFLLVCDEVKGAREQTFNGLKPLFDLPEETKQQHISPMTFNTYRGRNYGNLRFERFGIDDVLVSPTFETFTNLMWPQGNPPLWYFSISLHCLHSMHAFF